MPSLAFIGCGTITQKHSKLLRKIAPSLQRYYASRNAEKASDANRSLKGAGSFGSYGDAIASPDIDAVFICTPPDKHFRLAMDALAEGKHVLVEKPPFLSVAEFDEVAEAAEAAGKMLYVAENYYYKPLAGVLRRILKEEAVGRPLFLMINALKEQKTQDWRDEPSLAGRGALFEGGIHWVDVLANLGPSIMDVAAFRPGSQEGLDRSTLFVATYDNQMVGTLVYSWEVPTLFKGLRISRLFGTEGSVTFETNGLFVIVRGRRRRILFPGLSDISGYKAMLTDVVACLETGSAPQMPLSAARRDLVLVEHAYRNMDSKSSITPTL